MILPALLLASLAQKESSAEASTPVELGRVAWGRDHDAAFRAAKDSGKPLLLLFQEVPG